jgi:hypothetical protein
MEIEEWLDTNLYYENNNKHYTPCYNDITLYYNKNDSDIKKNNIDEIQDMRYFRDNVIDKIEVNKYHAEKMITNSRYVNKFKLYNNIYIHYIDQNTYRYLCSNLFNEIIDYCKYNNLLDFNNNPIINKMMREKFYKFCYNNSF